MPAPAAASNDPPVRVKRRTSSYGADRLSTDRRTRSTAFARGRRSFCDFKDVFELDDFVLGVLSARPVGPLFALRDLELAVDLRGDPVEAELVGVVSLAFDFERHAGRLTAASGYRRLRNFDLDV